MNVSEVATFFGPRVSPLFGVLHLPGDKRIRGGVMICGSLGREGMLSVRFQRILANDLASRGFAVLRFDYLGTGDSAYTQNRDSAVDDWRRSVGYAVGYLEEAGARSITAIGIRAGSLILGSAAVDFRSIERIVHVDPVGTGRRYLREQTALFTLSTGVDDAPVGVVSIIGARLNAQAAKEFRALRLAAPQPRGIDQLLILRPGDLDAQVRDLAELDEVESMIVDGLAGFAESAAVVTPMPLHAIAPIVDWVDTGGSAARTDATPRYQESVRLPSTGQTEGGAVVECIEVVGPDGLFAIRTRPESLRPGEGKVVLFNTSSNDPHVGPSREWVELSRRIATSGVQAVRWDRSGVGQSGPVNRKQWWPIYSRQGIRDVTHVAEHAAKDARNLMIVGSCSGSWYGAHAARAVGAGSVVLVNPRVWSWQIGDIRRWEWWAVKRPLQAAASSRPHQSGGKIVTLRKRAAGALSKQLKKSAHNYVPHYVLKMLGHLGLAQVPDVTLAALARAGTETTVLLSPWDSQLFARRAGHKALKRLEGAAVRPRLVTTESGDHALYHQAMLEAIRQVVLESVSSPRRPSAGSARSRETGDASIVSTALSG